MMSQDIMKDMDNKNLEIFHRRNWILEIIKIKM